MAQHKLLLADTDQAMLVRLKDTLRQRGFDVRTAIDGSKALEQALTMAPDVAIIGMDLPVVPTKQLLDILAVNPKTKGLPVLVMASKPVELKKLGLEPTEHLVKPVHIDALLDRVFRRFNRIDQVREAGGKNKEIAGNLAQIPLSDLLQILNLNKKDGTIQLDAGGQTGYIYLQEGQVINASVGKLEGEKAFYRILSWEDGKFDYLPEKALSPVRVKTSTENLLMEGMRHLDEMRRLAEKLPPMGRHLALNVDPTNLPKGLRPITQEIFLLLEFYSRIQDLVDNCLYPDYEVLQTLHTLLSKGLVKGVEERQGQAQQTLLGADHIRQLHKVLVGYRTEKVGKIYGDLLLLSKEPETAMAFINRCRTIEGFHSLPEGRYPDGDPVRVGPIGSLALGDSVEILFQHLPMDRTAQPYWHVLSTRSIGQFLLFESHNGSELAQLERANRFFSRRRSFTAYVDLRDAPENAEGMAAIRKLFRMADHVKIHPAPAKGAINPIPDLVKTILMHAIN